MALQSQMRLNDSVGKRLLNVREAAQYLGLEVDTGPSAWLFRHPGGEGQRRGHNVV